LLQNIENQPRKVRPDKMKKGLQTVILRPSDLGGTNFKPDLGGFETISLPCGMLITVF
jgi:hypothetical protein